MMNLRASRVRAGFALLGLLVAAGACRTPIDSPGTNSRSGEPGTTGAVELADVRMPKTPAAGPAEAGPWGGESLERVYLITLGECLTAGRLTFQDQKIRLTRQEGYSSWAALDGRFEDATPVRIKGEDLGEMRTKVLFTIGTRKSEYNQARVRALKEGFEERLLLAKPREP